MDAGNAGDPAAESSPWLHLSRHLGILRETTAESFSDRLLANLAAGLTGGQIGGPAAWWVVGSALQSTHQLERLAEPEYLVLRQSRIVPQTLVGRN